MKICTKCELSLPLENFYDKVVRGSIKKYAHCKSCDNAKSKSYKHTKHGSQAGYNAHKRQHRKDNREKYALRDYKRKDLKKGRDNDLDLDYLIETWGKPCIYCNRENQKMSLDRIDCNIGHTKVNTLPSCIRCNLIRGAMPYDVWLILVPKIKQMSDDQQFGSWEGGIW